jgi:GGDEF domain-containing protein
VLVKNSPMPGGGWVAIHEDITEQRRAEAQIAYMAHHDLLTELFNRSWFEEQLEVRLGRAARSERFAVFCLDLDRFKEVNDALGHPIGDLLLKAVACRLRDAVRGMNLLARFAGDEFSIFQAGGRQPTGASLLASDEVLRPVNGIHIRTRDFDHRPSAFLLPKRLELMHELVPTAGKMALLVNPTNPAARSNRETRERRLASLESFASLSDMSHFSAKLATRAATYMPDSRGRSPGRTSKESDHGARMLTSETRAREAESTYAV